jgi:3-oxoacyl-[acyl-carrier protein] reductase
VPVGPDSLLLVDRVAVVTGAAQGIGAAVAETFGRLGARLALCDRDEAGLRAVAGRLHGEHATAVLDVRDADAVTAFVSDAADRLGPVDVLVNNAGGGFRAAFTDVSRKGEAALIAENYTSVTAFVREVVGVMSDEGGSVVNITSIEAHRAAPGFATYAAMKAAVANLTKSLALELGDRRIRVNCVAPDVIPTPGIGEPPVRTPLPFAGHVDDVAGAAAYLASDLSRFVTGVTLHVDGGNHAAGGWVRGAEGGWET